MPTADEDAKNGALGLAAAVGAFAFAATGGGLLLPAVAAAGAYKGLRMLFGDSSDGGGPSHPAAAAQGASSAGKIVDGVTDWKDTASSDASSGGSADAGGGYCDGGFSYYDPGVY